jgi:hypothetical protein
LAWAESREDHDLVILGLDRCISTFSQCSKTTSKNVVECKITRAKSSPGNPRNVLDSEAIILDTGLHKGVWNPLPEILEHLGERLADALGEGNNLAAAEVAAS